MHLPVCGTCCQCSAPLGSARSELAAVDHAHPKKAVEKVKQCVASVKGDARKREQLKIAVIAQTPHSQHTFMSIESANASEKNTNL